MKFGKFGEDSDKLSWETRKAVWHCWAQGANIESTQIFFRENTHAYTDAPVDGDTIRQVRGELYMMPLDNVTRLISEIPAIRSFVAKMRPDLNNDLDALPVSAEEYDVPIFPQIPMNTSEKRIHNDELLNLIEKLGRGISDIISSEGISGHEAILKNDWENSQQYGREFWWIMAETRINKVNFSVELDEQFKYLAQHLQNEKFWGALQQWKTVIRQCLDVWYRWYMGDEVDYSLLKKTRQLEEDEGKALMEAFQEANQYLSLPGQCDLCRN